MAHLARRRAAAAGLAVLCVLAAACARKDDAPKQGAAVLETQDVRFYRHANERAVFRVSKTMYCLVRDEAQMAAFGGFAQVEVVAPNVDFKRGKTPVRLMYCPSP